MNTENTSTTPTPQPPPVPTPQAPAAPPAPPAVQAPPRKSPGVALFLSLVLPGLGQVYVGLYRRAVTIFALFFVAVTLDRQGAGLGWAIAFIYFFGLIDAYRQAQIMNRSEVTMPRRTKTGTASLGFGVFLTVIGAVLLINNFYPIDLSWLAKWWPAILVLIGLYLIASAYNERQKAAHALDEEETGEGPGA